MSDKPEEGKTRFGASFIAFVVTQFLGAFNDNAFKQLILLLAAAQAVGGEESSDQSLAIALFALPFLLFSGFAGMLADRYSKRRIIVLAKVGEIGIMALGALAFGMSSIPFLLITLFLMGSQSAFFGPAKYGVVPEIVPKRFIASANGILIMTTFVAIILGQAIAGWCRTHFAGELWKPQFIYIGLAVAGTIAAVMMKPLPAAQPDLPLKTKGRFPGSWLFGELWPSLKTISRDRRFLAIVIAHSFFWFLGAAMQALINLYGLGFLKLDDIETSLLLVSLSSGMAAGGVLGAVLSRGRIVFRLTSIGGFGVFVWIIALAFVGSFHIAWVHTAFVLLGISGSLFGMPLQAYIQSWPAEHEKGRVVAATNFINWVFICMSAVYIGIVEAVGLSVPWMPVPLGVAALVVIILLRPLLLQLDREARESAADEAS